MNYREQSEFPFLQTFKDKFAITPETIFAFDGTIYTDFNLPNDLLAHEETHLRRQKDNPEEWIKNYLADDSFRLNEEILAFIAQIKSIKDREMRNTVLIKAARSLASELYGGIISEEEALAKIK
jgi:hypothetical protein